MVKKVSLVLLVISGYVCTAWFYNRKVVLPKVSEYAEPWNARSLFAIETKYMRLGLERNYDKDYYKTASRGEEYKKVKKIHELLLRYSSSNSWLWLKSEFENDYAKPDSYFDGESFIEHFAITTDFFGQYERLEGYTPDFEVLIEPSEFRYTHFVILPTNGNKKIAAILRLHENNDVPNSIYRADTLLEFAYNNFLENTGHNPYGLYVLYENNSESPKDWDVIFRSVDDIDILKNNL